MARQIQGAQRDFSAGEVDVELKRSDDHPTFKAGLRQCSNFRILDTRKLSNRFGRSVKFIEGPRIDEVLISAGNVFYLVFGNGYLKVYNSAGVAVFGTTLQGDGLTPLPWTTATAKNVVWDVSVLSVYICFPGMRPQVLTFGGGSLWTLAPFTEQIIGNQKRTPFFRFAPSLGITIGATALTGAIQLNLSANYWVAGHVGTRIRYVGRQCLITSIVGPLQANAIVEEALPGAQTVTFTVDPATVYSLGDVCAGTATGTKGVVIAIPGGNQVQFQLLTTTTTTISTGTIFDPGSEIVAFTLADTIAGPGGALAPNAVGAITVPGAGQPVWDEEVMNNFRGYPSSVFADQGRLGFCNFPSLPTGIAWSAISVPNDLYVGAQPSNAIFEIVPGKSQVLYVAAGMQSSEFVFCDNAVYGIPISVTNPLKPGSVAFDKISDDGCAPVQPRRMQNVIIYINAGSSSCRAIMTTGAYYRQNESRDISEFHNHLFNGPIAIATPTADASYPERYFYILNSDGTAIAGKVDVQDGQIAPNTLPGWTTISGVGSIKWISARAANVMFTTTYSPGGVTPVTVAEQLDPAQFLDGAVLYNSLPPAMAAPPTLGPLWWLRDAANRGSVTVMDAGRPLGIYSIDQNGFLIPQNIGGENLASAQLMVGQTWTAITEPFLPAAASGADVGQRMDLRYVARFAVYVINSTGFLLAKLFSGKQTATSPPLGTIMTQRRIPAWNEDDDATQPPKLRETVESWRPSGGSYDPRVAIIKDSPGPLTIAEIGTEVSV